MNFSTFTKISSGNLIYFRNESPIENVGTLKFYKDNASGTFLKKEFRWSFDRNYWSSWETLNIGNIAKVNTGNNRYLFFEIKYTMTSPTAGKVTSFAVEYIVNPNETYAPAVEDVTNMDNNHILPDGCNDLGGTTKTFKTIEITDAETLCGKSCDYYLWRPNHKGTQPISSVEGLQNILNNLTSGLNDSITNALNVDGSGTGVFYQKSGKNLIFKKINPGAGSYIIESDGIITIGVDASLSAKDPSINDLYNLFYQLDTNLSDASIYIDYKFLQIDASLADLYAKDASIDGSIARLDASINQLWTYVDGSITQLWDYLDSSFSGQFVKESSLGPKFFWDASGLLDVSVSGGSFTGDISTSHVFYDPALDPSLAMPNTVGGIPAGTTVYDLQGDSLRSILNDLLFPTQYPTLTAPAAAISVAPSTLLYEVSANVNLTFTSTLNRGSINPQYIADSPYRSGLPNNFNFGGTGPGLVDISSNSIPYISPSFDCSIRLGTWTWSVAIGYDSGVQPFDSKGNTYDSSLSAGTVNSNTITITGVFPLFATTVDITTMTKQSLVSMSTPGTITLSMAAESGGNKQAFEVPDAWIGAPTNNPLTGIRTYNSVSGNYDYQGGSAASSLTYWPSSDSSENIQGYSVPYTRYTYNGTDRSSISIRLEF